MSKKADIGLIGLAVMGENLVLNMESKGFTVAVFNRTISKVDDFIKIVQAKIPALIVPAVGEMLIEKAGFLINLIKKEMEDAGLAPCK